MTRRETARARTRDIFPVQSATPGASTPRAASDKSADQSEGRVAHLATDARVRLREVRFADHYRRVREHLAPRVVSA